MLQKMSSLAVALSLALVAMVASPVASAAIDVSDVVTEIEGGGAPIGLIGGAVLVILAIVAIWKWVRRAF